MNQYRIEKCRVLFELAQQADGPIVELGSFHGMSTIVLDWGSGDNQVYAVDDWNRRGWAGEKYQAKDYETFRNNLDCAENNVRFIRGDITEVVIAWQRWDRDKVALIFWDTGVENCLVDHFRLWSKYVKKGGLFLVHDTLDCRLGWNELKEQVGDEWQVEEYPPLHGLRRL